MRGNFFRRLWREEDGSLILALLAIMVVSGLVLTTIAVVAQGQAHTRIDRNFEDALETAEVGLAQMNSLLQSNPTWATVAPLSGTTADGGSYATSATKSGTTWTVQSSGTVRGHTRYVQDQLVVQPLFSVAAYGKVNVTFQGGNGADSFDSALGTDTCIGSSGTPVGFNNPGTPTNASTASDDTNVLMCNQTRHGHAGTDGALFLKGGVAAEIDWADIYHAQDHVTDPLPDATGYCDGVTATCALYDVGKLIYHRDGYVLPDVNACTQSSTVDFNGTGTLGSRAYYFRDVTLTGNTVFTGTRDNPTVLCVSGHLSVAQQNLINFQWNATENRWVPRRPGSLLIFVTATSNSSVDMGNNASISAAIYAPNAAITCGPQGNVYGSMLANTINNNGGWNFHYDDDLAQQMINAPIRVQNWAETHP